MINQFILICIILPVIHSLTVINHDNDISSNDEEAALLGPDKFCFFAYSTRAKVSTIQKIYPNAERVGIARLPVSERLKLNENREGKIFQKINKISLQYHRLDFNYYLEEVKGSIPTVVPDCGYEVWGAIYTIPIQDLKTVLS